MEGDDNDVDGIQVTGDSPAAAAARPALDLQPMGLSGNVNFTRCGQSSTYF